MIDRIGHKIFSVLCALLPDRDLTTDQVGARPVGCHFFLPALAGFCGIIMAMKRRIKNRWNNIILIFRMMLRYWHYMLAGFVCMLLFAL